MFSTDNPPQIAVYLGVTKKKPVYVLELVPNPERLKASLRWGMPEEIVATKNDEGPGRLVELLLQYDDRTAPEGYEPEALTDEQEEMLAGRARVAMVLENYGKILIYPTRHYPGGGGYGNSREGIRGHQRMSDFELIQLARSL